MAKAKRTSYFLIVLLIGIIVVGGGYVGLSAVDVASGWQLYAALSSLTVNAKSVDAANNYQVSLDPDGQYLAPTLFLGDEPTVHAGISSSLSRSADSPPTVAGYDVYRYRFGLDVKTIAKKFAATSIYYEAEYATASVHFQVGLQAGSLTANAGTADVPDAQIMDVGVDGYAGGITAYPTFDAAQIAQLMSRGADPGKNVKPEVTTYTQANEGCIQSIDSTRRTASCGLTVKLRAGGVYDWLSFFGIINIAEDVTVYDVYAHYILKVDVAVKRGEAPPATNPFDWLTIILTDLSIKVKDLWDRWATEGLPLVVLIGAGILVVVVLAVCCYMRGFRRRRHK